MKISWKFPSLISLCLSVSISSFFISCLYLSLDMVSLWCPDWPGTHYVGQGELELCITSSERFYISSDWMIMNKTKNMIITNYTMRIIVIYFRKPIFLILISKSTYIDINNSTLRECFKKKKKPNAGFWLPSLKLLFGSILESPPPPFRLF